MMSIEAFIKEAAPRAQELTYGEGEDKLVVKVYPVLPFAERARMVREIVNGVFIGEGKLVSDYRPEMFEFLKKHTTMVYFTDIQLPEVLEDEWEFLNYTPVYDDVANLLGRELREIFLAAESTIEARVQHLIRRTEADSFMEKMGDLMQGLGEKISKEDIDKIMQGLQGASGNGGLQSVLTNLITSDKA